MKKFKDIEKQTKEEMTTTADIPNPADTAMGPKPVARFLDLRSKKKKKMLKQFRDYYAEKGIG